MREKDPNAELRLSLEAMTGRISLPTQHPSPGGRGRASGRPCDDLVPPMRLGLVHTFFGGLSSSRAGGEAPCS